MRRTIVALCILLGTWAVPATGWTTPLTPDHGCIGRWVGRGRNTGYSTYWTIDLTLTAAPEGRRCGTIRYTNPDCNGFLEDCRLVGNDIHTRENYTHRGRCAAPGQVVIRCEGDQMRYAWIGWERVDTILHRPGAGQGAQPSTVSTPPDIAPPPPPAPPPGQPSPTQPAQAPSTGQGPAPMQPSTTPPDVPSGSSWFPGCAVVPRNAARDRPIWLVVLAVLSLG